MIKILNMCCDCAAPGYPCRGNACELRHVEVHCCDECGTELNRIYEVDDGEYCRACHEELFD